MVEAVTLRENARDIDQAIVEIDSYIYRLQQIATEVNDHVRDVRLVTCTGRGLHTHQLLPRDCIASPERKV